MKFEVTIWHHFQDIITYLAYLTACDFEQSYIYLVTTVKVI